MKFSMCLMAAMMAATPAWGAQDELAGATSAATDTLAEVVEARSAATPTGDCQCLPAGTLVELEIDQVLSSAAQKRGDRFVIKLHAPILHGETVLMPTGTGGVGEIIHAERSRGGGKPGELLIAARYLDAGGVQVPLRGLKFGGQGKDNSDVALGAAMAIGLFAHFIRGREIEIPAGTVVTAKLAQDFPLHAADAEHSSEAATPAASSTTATPASTNKE